MTVCEHWVGVLCWGSGPQSCLAPAQPRPVLPLAGGRDEAHPDPRQLTRVIPKQARGPLHPLPGRCQLERELPQDQCEGVAVGRRGPGGARQGREGAGWPGRLQPSRLQENEKSPSQNRKAKDATSDNGKGQEWAPGGPRSLPVL